MNPSRTYNPHVRVGNWNEDLCLEEDQLKDFLDRKDAGTLAVNQTQRRHDTNMSSVVLSSTNDGYVHFGDTLMIVHNKTGAPLACDLTSPEPNVPVTGGNISEGLHPVVRNTFIIAPARQEQEGNGPLLFGEEFQIVSVSDRNPGGLYLYSQPKSFSNFSKYSRNQEVCLTTEASHKTLWKVQCYDPGLRLESQGHPVPVMERVVINHVGTNQALALTEKYTHRNMFGPEAEVCGKTFLHANKGELPENHWRFQPSLPVVIAAGTDCLPQQ